VPLANLPRLAVRAYLDRKRRGFRYARGKTIASSQNPQQP
jgi:hypothetical protein